MLLKSEQSEFRRVFTGPDLLLVLLQDAELCYELYISLFAYSRTSVDLCT
jgi:hypothetical protein